MYYNNDKPVHVGIIFREYLDLDGKTPRFWVLSKWGAAAEFEHFEDDVPEAFGQERKIYTDRNTI